MEGLCADFDVDEAVDQLFGWLKPYGVTRNQIAVALDCENSGRRRLNPSPAPALVAVEPSPEPSPSPVPLTEFTLSVTVTCEECGYPLNLPCVTKDDIVAIMATLSDKFGTGVAQLEEGYTVIAATAPTESLVVRSGPSPPPPSPPPPSPPPPAPPPSPPPAIPPLDARMQTWANNLTGGTRGATSWVLVALMVIALFTVLCCLYLAVRWFRRRRQEKYPSAKAAQGGVATNRLGGRLQLRQATPNVKRSQSGNARSPSVSRDGSQGSHGSHGSVDVHRTSMDAYIGGACSTSGAPVAGDIAVRLDQVQAAIDDVREALSPGGSASAVALRNALRSSGGSSDPRSPHNFPSPPGGGAPYVSRRGSGSGSAGSVSPGGRMSAIVPYGAPEGLGSPSGRASPRSPAVGSSSRRQSGPPPGTVARGVSSIEENPGAPPPQYAYGAYAGASAAPKPPASRTFLDYTFGRNRPRAVEEETESPKERAAGFDI